MIARAYFTDLSCLLVLFGPISSLACLSPVDILPRLPYTSRVDFGEVTKMLFMAVSNNRSSHEPCCATASTACVDCNRPARATTCCCTLFMAVYTLGESEDSMIPPPRQRSFW